MADYRLSASVISRGKGQSAIASAAYRAAARLDDPRTGETHDYTRKAGVVHSAILAPDNAPDWMLDRSQLWQAVEAAEKRRDAQLARELQLSLPHELTHEQRTALVVDFVRAEFVNQGMIADIAIHAPGRGGDDRNHHAHIMLTMRSLTGEGFGAKVRDWNDADTLARWREQWAHHQNRALEHHGHDVRVDHRSYEAQGIDREPTQHLGPTAADMERKGKPSRIGDENRAASFNNSARAARYGEHWDVEAMRQKAKFDFNAWADRRKSSLGQAAQQQIERERGQIEARHRHQSERLQRDLGEAHGWHKATISRELHAIGERLQAKGLRRLARNLMGRTRADEAQQVEMLRSLKAIEQQERQARTALARDQKSELQASRARVEEAQQKRLAGIERRRAERERADWLPQPTQEARPQPLQQAFRQSGEPPQATPEPDRQQAPEVQQEPPRVLNWWEKERGDADPSAAPEPAPWESRNLEDRSPWESDPERGIERERGPDRDDPKPRKD